ncbi:putative PTH11-type G-protein coupled receptor protein [Dactylonectria estremocensis]|uniref:PTH11-type G-protein coupled receptor protein n=1 Tax=Dactylonectria estremocensis TaxID=1079267 RepID=A0A9P9J627_9HYPO|nr:putative PTH11-type G-protein coupled receptor protein [Dactylonectria estremocensis]
MRHPQAPWAIFVVACLAIPGALGKASSTSALGTLPDCALECLKTSIGNSICSATNTTCICSNEPLQGNITACVTASCTVKESLTTKNGTMTLCGAPVRHHSTNYALASAILSIVSGLFVIQRFAFKLYARLDFGPDDWLTMLCALVGISTTCLAIYGLSPNGVGRDIWTLEFAKIYDFGKFFMIMEAIYFAEITLLKLAMLFFYLRIFPSPLIRQILWGTIIFNSTFGLIFVFIAVFQCKPISLFWQLWDGKHQGRCLDSNAIAWSNAAISIALDIWMLAIPIVQVHSLHLSLRKKIAVLAMFCVGTFITVISILRLHSLVKFGARSKNPTWEFHSAALWSTIEINVGIICNCLPSFRQFLIRLLPGLQSTSDQYQASYDGTPSRSNNRIRQFETVGTSNNRTPFKNSSLGPDNDEIQLVRIRDHDTKSARSGISMQSTL